MRSCSGFRSAAMSALMLALPALAVASDVGVPGTSLQLQQKLFTNAARV